jgi:putative membrane protein
MAAEDTGVRDRLAMDRTVLANERTLLAYVRTAFAFLAGGVTLLKVFPGDAVMVRLGVFLLAVGVFSSAFGAWRFVSVMRRLGR